MRGHKPSSEDRREAVDPTSAAVADSQALFLMGGRGFDPAIEHALLTQQPLDEDAYSEPLPWWRRVLRRGRR